MDECPDGGDVMPSSGSHRSGLSPGLHRALAVIDRALRRPRVAGAIVLLLALVVRATFVADNPRPALAYDEILYDGLAANVLAGAGYSLDGVQVAVPAPYRDGPTAIMAPGYPAFLMAVYTLFGREPAAVRLLQALVGALGCLLVFAVALAWRPLPLPGRASQVALVAGLLAAFSRVLVGWTNLVLSENLAVPAVLFAIAFLLRPPARWPLANVAAVSGALGLAIHVRGEMALISVVAVLWLAFVAPGSGAAGAATGGVAARGMAGPAAAVGGVAASGMVGPAAAAGGVAVPATTARGRRAAWRARDATWLTVALVALMAPWTVRNLRALGGFVFVRSFSGPVMYYANNELLRSTWAMALGETAMLPAEADDLPAGDELALDRLLRRTALDYVRDHPDRVANAAVLKSALFWRPIEDPWRPPGSVANTLLGGVAAFWLSALGAAAALRRPRKSALIVAVLLAEAVFVALFGAWERERFRTPLYSLELILTAAGIVLAFAGVQRALDIARSDRSVVVPRRILWSFVTASALGFAWLALSHRTEPIVAFSAFDEPAELLAWHRLQGGDDSISVDVLEGARAPGSLRLATKPPAGWQDIELDLAPGTLRPSRLYRVSFNGRAQGGAGGQVYPLIPGAAEGGGAVGLVRCEFADGDWTDHSFYFTAPFDPRDPVAVYVSHADYQVPGAWTWIDDLAVRESSWARFLWDGYVLGNQ